MTTRFTGTKFGQDLQNNRNRNYAQELLQKTVTDGVVASVPEDAGTVKDFIPFSDENATNPTVYEALYTNYCKNHGAVGTNPSAAADDDAPTVITVISDDTDEEVAGDWVLVSGAQPVAMSADFVDIASINKVASCVIEVAIISDLGEEDEAITMVGRTFCSRVNISTVEGAVTTTIPYITGSKSLNMPVIPAGSAVYARCKASALSTTITFALSVCWYPQNLNTTLD